MATRLWVPSTGSAPVSVAYDSWTETADADAPGPLNHTKGTSAIAAGATIGFADAAGTRQLMKQFVSPQMAAGSTSGWTWKGYLMVREFDGLDNIDRLVSSLRIVSADGSTVVATLSSLLHRGPTGEFINNATFRTKAIADGDALANVSWSDGARLVLELGAECSAGGTTPQVAAKWGENASDSPENQSTTTDVAGWIELSGNIVWYTEGQASLEVDIGLTADGMVEVAGEAALEIGIELSAQGTVDIEGAASLEVPIGLDATGTNDIEGVATLEVPIGLTATGVIEDTGPSLLGEATLEIQIELLATGLVSMGMDRSPLQTFSRAAPFPTTDRPAGPAQPRPTFDSGGNRIDAVDLGGADDIVGLPWTRRSRWTTASFRARVLFFIRTFLAARPAARLVGWDVVEVAGEGRDAGSSYLRIGLTQRVNDQNRRVEAAMAFGLNERSGDLLEAKLVLLEGTFSALIV